MTRSRQYWSRRIRRHVTLAVTSGAAMIALFSVLNRPDRVWKASMASAYVGLALLAVSLGVGPYNVLRRRANPVSTDLRRDIGIWAGVWGLAHFAVGLNVHLRGRPWLYFLWGPDQPHRIPVRYDLFGFANFTGLGAVFVLLLLLALSNDLSLRRFGSRRWKALQRWNYVGFGLILLHGVAFQLIEKRAIPFVMTFGGILVLVIGLQLAGYRHVRAERALRDAATPET